MGLARFSIYKYVKISGVWRYCRVGMAANGKPKPNVVMVNGKEEVHTEGRYYLAVRGQWVNAGDTATEAMAARSRSLLKQNYERETGEQIPEAKKADEGTPLAEAARTWFNNLAAQGKDPKTLTAYHAAVDPFTAQCRKTVEEIGKQDLFDHLVWLRKQPRKPRKHANPDRTLYNKLGNICIFLKAAGRGGLLTKKDFPTYTKKSVIAHTNEELEYLYSQTTDDVTRFFLDFCLGSGFRDGELAHAEYSDLKGNMLLVQRKEHFGWKPKQHHVRQVPIHPALADAIRARGKSGLIFPNEKGKPNQHLLRVVQRLAKGGGFHSELHKLRKTWATRCALAGVALHTLQKWLGHESLATTQDYLADVELHKGQTEQLIAAATFVPSAPVGLAAVA